MDLLTHAFTTPYLQATPIDSVIATTAMLAVAGSLYGVYRACRWLSGHARDRWDEEGEADDFQQ